MSLLTNKNNPPTIKKEVKQEKSKKPSSAGKNIELFLVIATLFIGCNGIIIYTIAALSNKVFSMVFHEHFGFVVVINLTIAMGVYIVVIKMSRKDWDTVYTGLKWVIAFVIFAFVFGLLGDGFFLKRWLSAPFTTESEDGKVIKQVLVVAKNMECYKEIGGGFFKAINQNYSYRTFPLRNGTYNIANEKNVRKNGPYKLISVYKKRNSLSEIKIQLKRSGYTETEANKEISRIGIERAKKCSGLSDELEIVWVKVGKEFGTKIKKVRKEKKKKKDTKSSKRGYCSAPGYPRTFTGQGFGYYDHIPVGKLGDEIVIGDIVVINGNCYKFLDSGEYHLGSGTNKITNRTGSKGRYTVQAPEGETFTIDVLRKTAS